MQPERSGPRRTSLVPTERVADTLFDLAGDQEVRVIEALAAVLARQLRVEPGPPRGLRDAPAQQPFASEACGPDIAMRRAICRRIARRALHGSLVDPTRGATAVHRIDDSPTWSRELLPIGMFGPFLFYRPPPARWRAGDWPPATRRGQQQIAGLNG